MSSRQYWYLKQKYSAERAAYWAYFDMTGETSDEAWERQNREIAERTAVSFDPEGMAMHRVPSDDGRALSAAAVHEM